MYHDSLESVSVGHGGPDWDAVTTVSQYDLVKGQNSVAIRVGYVNIPSIIRCVAGYSLNRGIEAYMI